MSTWTDVFHKVVADVMRPPPPVLPATTSVGEAVRRMADVKATCVVLQDADGHAAGIVTEQDIVRRAAFRAEPDAPAGTFMSSPVASILSDDHLFHAIARMRSRGFRHMPVVDPAGAVVGMLDLHDAQASATAGMTAQIERLTSEPTVEGLTGVKTAQVDLARELFADNLPAPEILALLTHINRDIHRRVVERALAAMAQDGAGAPPVPFAMIVMGSGGRGENYLLPDQDNGFIIDDYPDEEHARVDGFFIDLAERVTRDLDAIGFPLCRGYVMATNPLWRKTRSQWRDQLVLWARRRNVVTLRLADIFFDFASVYGVHEFAADLRAHVTRLAANNPALIQAMHRDDTEHGVALGLFGRLVTEKEVDAHRGEINLKHTGTLPLVEGLRTMALRHGVADTGTLDRIDALRAAGTLDADDYDELTGAFNTITRLLLRQQLEDFSAGRGISNYLPPKALSRRERRHLVQAFRAIREFRGRLRAELTGDVF